MSLDVVLKDNSQRRAQELCAGVAGRVTQITPYGSNARVCLFGHLGRRRALFLSLSFHSTRMSSSSSGLHRICLLHKVKDVLRDFICSGEKNCVRCVYIARGYRILLKTDKRCDGQFAVSEVCGYAGK